MSISTKIWASTEDLKEYAKELEKSGRKESGEGLWSIISQLESLLDYMDEHPKK